MPITNICTDGRVISSSWYEWAQNKKVQVDKDQGNFIPVFRVQNEQSPKGDLKLCARDYTGS